VGQVAEGGGGEAMRKYDRLCAEIEGIEVRLKKLQKDDVGTPQAVIAKVRVRSSPDPSPFGGALARPQPCVPGRGRGGSARAAGGGRAAARFHSAPNWTTRRPRRCTAPLC
jgi:hypothetical protein